MAKMPAIAFAAAALATTMLPPASADACTGLTLQAKNDATVVARTLEFGVDLDSNIIFVPRGQDYTGTTDDGPGMTWKNRYAFMGENFFDMPQIVDGFNEKGLYVGMFYMPGYAKFQDVQDGDQKRALAQWELPAWLLGNFASVEEVRKGMEDIVVANAYFKPLDQVLPVHYLVTDASGKSLTIEYTGGERHVYDNPVGVLTNAPEFPWHLTNLSNYVNLHPEDATGGTIRGLEIKPTGSGSGMIGLPGDFTPPSRFVRAVYLAHSALPPADEEEAVTRAWQLIDNISIVEGAVRAENAKDNPVYDATLWTNVNDLANQRLYFRTYDNTAIRFLDMSRFDADGDKILTVPMDQKPSYQNVNDQAK